MSTTKQKKPERISAQNSIVYQTFCNYVDQQSLYNWLNPPARSSAQQDDDRWRFSFKEPPEDRTKVLPEYYLRPYLDEAGYSVLGGIYNVLMDIADNWNHKGLFGKALNRKNMEGTLRSLQKRALLEGKEETVRYHDLLDIYADKPSEHVYRKPSQEEAFKLRQKTDQLPAILVDLVRYDNHFIHSMPDLVPEKYASVFYLRMLDAVLAHTALESRYGQDSIMIWRNAYVKKIMRYLCENLEGFQYYEQYGFFHHPDDDPDHPFPF